MDNCISSSLPQTNGRQTRINAINTEAERLKRISEGAAKTGKLPDFGKPYEQLSGIEKQLYDIAQRRQALERQILKSCGLLDERVRKVCDSADEVRDKINNIGKSKSKLEKSLSKFTSKITNNKVFRFLNRALEYCLFCE